MLDHFLHRFTHLHTAASRVHWTEATRFRVSNKPLLLLGRQLAQSPNVAGHLLTLEGRSIIGPLERLLWPDLDALAWRRREVLR